MQLAIESIFGTINFGISILIIYKLSLLKKGKKVSINARYFSYIFYLFAIVFLFSAISISSILHFQVDFFISAINIIGRGLILLAVMFFTYIPLKILGEKFWKNFLPLLILIVAIFSTMVTLISLFNYPRTPVGQLGNFIIRLHRTDFYTQVGIISIGALSLFSLIFAIVKYLKVINTNKNDTQRHRGYVLILAGIIFGFGLWSNYFCALMFPVIGRFMAEIIYSLALLIFLISILHKKKDFLIIES